MRVDQDKKKRVYHESESDVVRLDHEKKSNMRTLHHKKKSDGVRV